MANAEAEFSAEAVGRFLLDNGGRVTNVQVVGHFAKYLNDSEFKVLNRQKFKDFINEVATVKTEKGTKYLVVKDEFLYRDMIEPKHVIIRSAATHHSKPSWPPPADELLVDKDADPEPPARRRKKSRDHQGGESKSGSKGKTKKDPTSPRPVISDPQPIYTGPAEQDSVISSVRGEKVVEDLSQIEGVQNAKQKFELEARLHTPSPAKPQPSVHALEYLPVQRRAQATPSPPPPPPVEIQVTEDATPATPPTSSGNGRVEDLGPVHHEIESTPTGRPPAPTQTADIPVTHVTPAVAARAAVADSENTEASPSVQMARKLFESEARKQSASLGPEPRARSSPRLSPKKSLPNGSAKHHNHEDDDHGVIGADLSESVSSDTLRSVKSTGSGNSFPEAVKLEPLERQWMMESAKGNVPALLGLAEQEPSLVSKKDFITGFSALHWGAKHGKKEMIRLVAERGIDVNMRSQGGYTPLHVAAMHNREAIMQFLVTEYNADINKRDYSGRKAHHYLQNCASAYIKQRTAAFSRNGKKDLQ